MYEHKTKKPDRDQEIKRVLKASRENAKAQKEGRIADFYMKINDKILEVAKQKYEKKEKG